MRRPHYCPACGREFRKRKGKDSPKRCPNEQCGAVLVLPYDNRSLDGMLNSWFFDTRQWTFYDDYDRHVTEGLERFDEKYGRPKPASDLTTKRVQ
jgi:hypothetical protein